MKYIPEDKEIVVGAGVVRCEDGPITFNSLGSLRLHENDICLKASESSYKIGFRMGFTAAVCILGAAWLFSWLANQ